jgi:hypothetical protein
MRESAADMDRRLLGHRRLPSGSGHRASRDACITSSPALAGQAGWRPNGAVDGRRETWLKSFSGAFALEVYLTPSGPSYRLVRCPAVAA